MFTQQLNQGMKARFLSFGQTDLAYKRRLLALGLTPGAEILVVRKAPFGCPIELKLRGSSIILRIPEAKTLEWLSL